MNIRPYTPKDKDAVLKLLDENSPAYFDASERPELVRYLDEELEDYFVVEAQEGIIGAGGINYEPEKRTAIISWDLISPNCQGQGVGSELTQYRIGFIKAKSGIDTILVRTSQHTDQFYQKMGFKLMFIKKDYWAKGYDLYQMEQANLR